MVLIGLEALLIVIYTFQSFFCKLFSAHYKGDESASSTVFTVMFGGVVGTLSLIFNQFRFSPSPLTWLLGILCALSVYFYNLAMVKAPQKGPYSLVAIFMLFGGLLAPIFLSCIVLHQPLSVYAIVGMVVLLVAFVALNATKLNLKGTALSFYVWCVVVFIANGAFGCLLQLHVEKMDNAERWEFLVIAYLGSALLALLTELVDRAKAEKNLPRTLRRVGSDYALVGTKSWLYGAVCWICATAGVIFSMTVLGMIENGSVFYAINNGGVLVFTVLLSVLVLKERPTKIQIVGLILATVSIVLVSF